MGDHQVYLLVLNCRLSPRRKTERDVPETDGAETDVSETDGPETDAPRDGGPRDGGRPRRRSPRREVRLFLFVCFIERFWQALVRVTVRLALSGVFM